MSKKVVKQKVDLSKFRKVETGYAEKFHFEKIGDAIMGVVVSKREVPSKDDGKIMQFLELDTASGYFSVGVSANMRTFFREVVEGQTVYIQLSGLKKTGKAQPMKEMECYILNEKPVNQVVKKR